MTRIVLSVFALFVVSVCVGCSTAPKTPSDRQALINAADAKLSEATTTDPTLRPVLDSAAGYAVFPEAGRGGVVVGGGYGKGVLYQNQRIIGYCDMSLASAGAELGGKQFTEIIVFKTPNALEKFKQGQFAFRADASAVALKSGAAANTEFKDNTAVYVMSQKGLMVDASLGAQSFTYEPAAEIAQPAGGRMDEGRQEVQPSGPSNY